MPNSLDSANRVLMELAGQNIVEPIDDPSLEVNFWEWADVLGIVKEFVPQEYDHA